MRLSARCRYGLRAVFDIAFHNEGRPTQAREMALRQGVGPRMLEQVLGRLKKARVVGAQRGRRGGYYLARPAHEISLGDIVRACDGALELTVGQADGGPAAPADAIWSDAEAQILQVFDALNVAELCRRSERAGVPRAAAGGAPMYFI